MPATPARAEFVVQEFRSVVRSDSAVLAQYGKVARDTGDTPIDTFFDSMADVATMANERGALLGGHARAFRVTVNGLIDLDGAFAMTDALPGAHLRDAELVADLDCVVTTIEAYDTAADQTVLSIWGTV